ncbi:uncharacterized protein [Argopecten irradians]|uniref:uncharacterized protein n=1 Tax=Argopecten irradians TaxID=31199 RepID=UPI00370FB880
MTGLVRFRDDSPSDFLEEEDNCYINEDVLLNPSSDSDSEDDWSHVQQLVRLSRRRQRDSEPLLYTFPEPDDDTIQPQKTPLPLLDLSASATALHYSWESLEKCVPPLDQHLLKKISRWSFPSDEKRVKCCARLCMKSEDEWRKAQMMRRDGYIREMRQVGLMLTAVVGSPTSKISAKVTLKFERQTIVSTKCSRCPKKLWCCHILSVALYRIKEADKVPVYPPMTEILSDLSRDQLQKLLQCAITNDPEALLPVFSNLDAVQDRKSDLYNQKGAPDPTFGVEGETNQMWDLSFDKLKADMNHMLHNYEYPLTCDFVKKAASPFHRKFFQRIPELVNSGHIEQAGKVLIIITKALLDVLPSDADDSLWEAFLDSERMYSCFISSYSGPIREDLISSAIEINRKCEVMRAWLEFPRLSSWVRITSIGLGSCLQDLRRRHKPKSGQDHLREVEEASSEAAFYQPVCASLIPISSNTLQDLLSGEHPPFTSKYDEALPVLLLRFDSLVMYGSDQSSRALFRLGVTILKKLLIMSSHLSILGCNSPAFAAFSFHQDDDTEPSEAKRARLEDDGSQPTLSERQITLAMLYICYVLVKTNYMKTVRDDDPSLQVVIESMYRAIELGYLRPVYPRTEDDPLEFDDYVWLHEMEVELTTSYLYQSGRSSKVEQCYVDRLLSRGLGFYNSVVPIGLLHTLCMSNSGSELEDTIVKICLEAVCTSVTPFKGKNPENFLSIHEENWTEVLCLAYKVFFCENSQVEAEKMIAHFSKLHDSFFAHMAYDAFENHIFNDRWGKDDLNISSYPIQFVLCFIRQSLKHDWKPFLNQYKVESIGSLLAMIGLEEPGKVTYHLLEDWRSVSEYFNETEVEKFLDIMNKFVKNSTNKPLDGHFQFVLDHMERTDTMHKPPSCYILKVLNTDALQQKALENVMWNYKSYTADALLWIAKYWHETIESPRLPEMIFCRHVFHLLQLAFYKIREQIRKKGTSATEKDQCIEQVKWFFNVIAGEGTPKQAKGNQFDVFLRELDETYSSMPMFLLSFFETICLAVDLQIKATKKLGQKVMMQLQSEFISKIESANTIPEYDEILKRLSEAQRSCYFNGICKSLNDFRLHVTVPIRLHHSTKGDFMSHMDKHYSNLFYLV